MGEISMIMSKIEVKEYELPVFMRSKRCLPPYPDPAGFTDIYLARYNSDGSLYWAKRAGGSNGRDEVSAITALSDDSTVVTATFTSTIIFGPGEPNETILTSAGGDDIFITRFQP